MNNKWTDMGSHVCLLANDEKLMKCHTCVLLLSIQMEGKKPVYANW